MSKIYDTAFKVGVAFIVFVFGILNLINFLDLCGDYTKPRFAPGNSCSWGFPFKWNTNNFEFIGDGLILNVFIISLSSFICGFLFKFAWSEMERKNNIKD